MPIVEIITRIALTATASAPFLSPRPTQRAAAIAAASVTRTSSRARLRSGDWGRGPDSRAPCPEPNGTRAPAFPRRGRGRPGSPVRLALSLDPPRRARRSGPGAGPGQERGRDGQGRVEGRVAHRQLPAVRVHPGPEGLAERVRRRPGGVRVGRVRVPGPHGAVQARGEQHAVVGELGLVHQVEVAAEQGGDRRTVHCGEDVAAAGEVERRHQLALAVHGDRPGGGRAATRSRGRRWPGRTGRSGRCAGRPPENRTLTDGPATRARLPAASAITELTKMETGTWWIVAVRRAVQPGPGAAGTRRRTMRGRCRR